MPILQRLVELLDKNQASYRLVNHPSAGKSAEVALARGTEVGQGAKALVYEMINHDGSTRRVLAVLPADRQLDWKMLASALSAKKARLLGLDETRLLTSCEIGAIPPFSFNEELLLVVDPQLQERYKVIAFNAGRLDTSILLDTSDYLAIAKPRLLRIAG